MEHKAETGFRWIATDSTEMLLSLAVKLKHSWDPALFGRPPSVETQCGAVEW